MVKLIRTIPNIVAETEYNSIKLDPNNPTIHEVVEVTGETKKVWKVGDKQYSKKTGTEKQRGTGQGQHWEHAFKLSKVALIIDESDDYYRTEDASNWLVCKKTLKTISCPQGIDTYTWMDTLAGTK